MNLKCPKCGYGWDFKGRARRVQCLKCGKFFYNPIFMQKPANNAETCKIKDDIMHGNILDALNKANIDPINHNELSKDWIPILLEDNKLKFAFAEACEKLQKSPEKVLRMAIKDWLKQKEYL